MRPTPPLTTCPHCGSPIADAVSAAQPDVTQGQMTVEECIQEAAR